MWIEEPVVIIDDDPDDQYFYKKTLDKLQLPNPLIFFDNGKDALQFLQQPSVSPFVILCDINMPVMSGLEMRELMCASPDFQKKNTPFIFLTTSARPEDIRKASSLYTHGFFQKETSLEKHEQTLKKIVDYWMSCRYVNDLAPSKQIVSP
jgi:CheY-like chemotaxis protein